MFAPPQFLQLQKNRIRTMAFFASLKRKQSREGSLFFYFLNNLERWVPYPKLHDNFSSSIHSCFYTVFLNSNAGTQLPISLEFDFYMDRLFTHLLWIDFNGFFCFFDFPEFNGLFFCLSKERKPSFMESKYIFFIPVWCRRGPCGAAFWILAEIENTTFCSLQSIKYLNQLIE